MSQMNLDGLYEHTGEHTAEVRRICERYPRALDDPGMCLFRVAWERYPWIAQLPEQSQQDLRELARDWPSVNRRRQELSAELKERQRGL